MSAAHEQAKRMLETFAGIGAQNFGLSWRTRDDEQANFRYKSLWQLRRELPAILDQAEADRLNLILRPRFAKANLIQLDDIAKDVLQRVLPVSFLAISTSPGKAQAWIAVHRSGSEEADKELRRRVKKAANADKYASEAVRVAGSLNIKAKYEQEEDAPDYRYPRVEITHAQPGLIIGKDQLAQLGLIAQADPPAPPAPQPRQHFGPMPWPDYAKSLAGARRKADGQPDRSAADFNFCLYALQMGHSIEDTAAKLLEVSEKARERKRSHGEQYAENTARNAARAVAENRSQGKGRGRA